ncbi:hypothetical protein [Actinomadura napierensis]|uniref:Uncharacterized protein n=1 Tax=Actinomadura napierensis TaxID=267854 RepID=A0ABN3ACU1_9ACTN
MLVVGDGGDDAAALAAAYVGIAVGRAGFDLALETADAVVSLSRRVRRLVVQSLVVAVVFTIGLVIWDLAGAR